MSKAPTLTELFRKSVERHPGAVAIWDNRQTISYAALDAISSDMALALLERSDLAGGAPLGLLVDDDFPATIAAVLGILKAGRGYVPLDPRYPQERLRFMLEDSGSVGIVFPGEARAELAGTPIYLGGIRVGRSRNGDLTSGRSAHDLSYVIYTSGSTGRPKGVPVRDSNVVSLIEATIPLVGATSADTWSLFHSLSFDFSIWEIWGALATGGTIAIVPRSCRRRGKDFARFIAESRTTILNLVPSAFRTLFSDVYLGPSDLRHVVFGGEPVDYQSVKTWRSMNRDARVTFWNLYGITEATVHATARRIEETDLEYDGPGTLIGRAIAPHVKATVLNGTSPVAQGEVGELCLWGPGVVDGYYNRPDETAERFLEWDGRGLLLRTGDLALWDRTVESLVYRGRKDEQVQVRGYRVEPSEIEAAIRQTGVTADVAVSTSEDQHGVAVLVAYLVPGSDAVDPGYVAARLRAILPHYLVPSVYVTVASLPLTASGKVDRLALRNLHRPGRDR